MQLSDGKTSLDNYATLIKTLNSSGDAQKQGIASKLLTSGMSRAEIDAYGLTKYFPVDKYKDGVASYMDSVATYTTGASTAINTLSSSTKSSLNDLDAALNGGTLTDGTKVPTGLVSGTQTVQAGLNEVNAKVNVADWCWCRWWRPFAATRRPCSPAWPAASTSCRRW